MAFKIRIEPEAYQDIQDGIHWYNKQQAGLGSKFHAQVKAHLAMLKINPFFQKRYDDARCLPVKNFPYMIHYSIDEINHIVTAHAVFHTSLNPEEWGERD